MSADIATMQAGAEMNALVAERVFGECPHRLVMMKADNSDPTDDYINWRCRHCRKAFRGLRYRSTHDTWRGMRTSAYPHPHYSTDIAAAWLVVEKLRGSGYLVRIQEHPDGFPFFREAVDPATGAGAIHKRALCLIERVQPLGSHRVEGQGYGDTAALAICRAALLALEAGR
jgi:hypothetical protein